MLFFIVVVMVMIDGLSWKDAIYKVLDTLVIFWLCVTRVSSIGKSVQQMNNIADSFDAWYPFLQSFP